jgi:predicted RNA-binding protein with PIN domain
MKHYIIDGNNLIGKIKNLSVLQAKDKQSAREQLVYFLNNVFSGKKIKVSLHLDGFPGAALNISKGKIFYSESKTADEKIKDQITNTKNVKELVVISSDNGIRNYAKVCGCSLQTSEEFYKEYISKNKFDDEEKRIKEINDVEEFKRLFNVKK